MSLKPWIFPGAVQIGDMAQVVDDPNAKIYEVDLPFTFEGSFTHIADGRRLIVRIHPGRETLSTNGVEKPTEILFEVEDAAEWISLAEAVRNVVRICLYRSPAPL